MAKSLGVVVHTYNSNTWEVKAGGVKFKASLGYIVRPCPKNGRKERMAETSKGFPKPWKGSKS
jgi:hypothetical protein